jgi:hypothetical protein
MAEHGARLWALHVTGPDELIAEPDERRARIDKATCDRLDSVRGPADPVLAAQIVEWPYSPEAHAAQLRAAAQHEATS